MQDFIKKLNDEYVIIFTDLSNLLIKKRIKYDDVLKSTIDIFNTLLKNKNTIILPTYNFNFPKTNKTGFSEKFITSGSLLKSLIKEFKFNRTHKPMYNYAVLGKNEKKILSLKQKTSWGQDSVIGFLGRNKSYGLGIGVDHKTFTWVVIHSCEETLEVPYRFFTSFKGYHVNLKKIVNEKMFARHPDKPKVDLKQKKVLKKLLVNRNLIQTKTNNLDYSLINLKEYYKENLSYLKNLDIWSK
jgi:aminoglycoside N3'-acetyltransferase